MNSNYIMCILFVNWLKFAFSCHFHAYSNNYYTQVCKNYGTLSTASMQDFMFKMLSEQLVSLRKDISTLHKDVEELKMGASKRSRKRVCQ